MANTNKFVLKTKLQPKSKVQLDKLKGKIRRILFEANWINYKNATGEKGWDAAIQFSEDVFEPGWESSDYFKAKSLEELVKALEESDLTVEDIEEQYNEIMERKAKLNQNSQSQQQPSFQRKYDYKKSPTNGDLPEEELYEPEY